MIHPSLAPLAQYDQFILYKTEPLPDNPYKLKKIPINPRTGWPTDAHLPDAWISAANAFAAAQTSGLGIGFVFTDRDPFFFLDVDECLFNGQLNDIARHLVNLTNGAAIETSVSGRGLHIIGSGRVDAAHKKVKSKLGFDLYTSRRFVALTGHDCSGNVLTDCTPVMHSIVEMLDDRQAPEQSADWTDGPVSEWAGPEDDEELIRIMLRSQSAAAAFGDRASIRSLWEADVDELGKFYPHPEGLKPFDHSQADQALCQHLAFWTGKDCERIERLFSQSGLVRDKWESREPYRRETILNAVSWCSNVYTERSKTPAALSADIGGGEGNDGIKMSEGFRYLHPDAQVEHFKGCVYVRDMHRVLVPDGALLPPEQFNATYGGYVFAVDFNSETSTKKAFEAFTQSQAVEFPKVHQTCFRPKLKTGEVFEEEGTILVNKYVEITTPSVAGDPTPLLDLIRRMLPDQGDQAVLLSYMAAVVQYKGVKFQWCPLLQGVQGNGKTLMIKVLEKAIGRKYTHIPSQKFFTENGSNFNGWIDGRLLIGVEEIWTRGRVAVVNAMKDLITNDRIEVEHKGVNQSMIDNFANWFMCSNFKDGYLKSEDDRRCTPLFTAQQTTADLLRDGMGGAYFPNLYNWFHNQGGAAICTHFLQNYPIPDQLNPATSCHRAPVTTSTQEAIEINFSPLEQAIKEAVGEGALGFAGGWVSSIHVKRLADSLHFKITPHKIKETLFKLGYSLHPHLPEGRANSWIRIDNGRPRLYIAHSETGKKNLSNGAEIAQVYETDQTTAIMQEAPNVIQSNQSPRVNH
jgi:primase-polymerase (primpol)-like protein